VVRAGDSFWHIAEARVGGGSPEAVARYWIRLVAANTDRLPLRGDPDLLFVGDQVLLPPL
jgi:nucleoid-associated protein YgaU